jgi:hypothetical protein
VQGPGLDSQYHENDDDGEGRRRRKLAKVDRLKFWLQERIEHKR